MSGMMLDYVYSLFYEAVREAMQRSAHIAHLNEPIIGVQILSAGPVTGCLTYTFSAGKTLERQT